MTRDNHFKLLIAQINIRNGIEEVIRIAKAETYQSDRVRLCDDFKGYTQKYLEKLSKAIDKMGVN